MPCIYVLELHHHLNTVPVLLYSGRLELRWAMGDAAEPLTSVFQCFYFTCLPSFFLTGSTNCVLSKLETIYFE